MYAFVKGFQQSEICNNALLLQRHGLMPVYRAGNAPAFDAVYKWIRRLAALCLLDAAQVLWIWQQVLSNPPITGDAIMDGNIRRFRDYYAQTWARADMVEIFNHADNDGPRTTNHAEGYVSKKSSDSHLPPAPSWEIFCVTNISKCSTNPPLSGTRTRTVSCFWTCSLAQDQQFYYDYRYNNSLNAKFDRKHPQLSVFLKTLQRAQNDKVIRVTELRRGVRPIQPRDNVVGNNQRIARCQANWMNFIRDLDDDVQHGRITPAEKMQRQE